MKRVCAVVALVMLSGCTSHPPLAIQEGVDLQRYAGTWHEQVRLPNRFQKQCVGDVQAHYVLQPDKTIRVTNRCRNAAGAVEQAEGLGRLADDGGRASSTSRLQVRFAPAWLSWMPMVWGDYWIIQVAGDYQYALVGTPDREFLWVLSREPIADDAVIQRLLAVAHAEGFDVSRVTRSHLPSAVP